MDSLEQRMAELRNLEPGWLDGDGVPPSPAGLDWFVQVFEQRTELPLPFIFPTPEGGIECNWTFMPHDVTLEIDLESHVGQWHWLNHETKEDYGVMDMNLDDDRQWAWIGENLAEYERDAK